MIIIVIRRFFILSVFSIGVVGFCFTFLNGEEVGENEEPVEIEQLHRNPFSLPKGVRSEIPKWKKGEVAKNVNGVFKSGKDMQANINGKWTKVGNEIGEERVLEIRNDAVVMIGNEGEKRVLLLPWTETDLKVIKKVKPKSKEEK